MNRDETLNYACPNCGAAIDAKCRTPGRKTRPSHVERRELSRSTKYFREHEDTLAFLAFCERKPYKISFGLETDGTTLKDRFGLIARWTDETRICINEIRVDLHALEKFLDYWKGYYRIGVSRGSLELTNVS